VAAIHPMIGLGHKGVAMHSKDFADVSMTPEGDKGLEVGVKALAMASVELLTNPETLAAIKAEFESRRLN